MSIDQDLPSVIQDDTLLSCQWTDLRRGTCISPERRLYLAILEDALRCIVRGTARAAERNRLDALFWIRGATDCLVSFEWVCDALSIEDTNGFRERILKALGSTDDPFPLNARRRLAATRRMPLSRTA